MACASIAEQRSRARLLRGARAAVLRDAAGVSAAEFAIAAPILLGLLVPLGDLMCQFASKRGSLTHI